MARETLKRIDILRHELKALRFILDNLHPGKSRVMRSLRARISSPNRAANSTTSSRRLPRAPRRKRKSATSTSTTSISNRSCGCRASITTPIPRWCVSAPRRFAPGPSRSKPREPASNLSEIYFLLDGAGSLVVYQEKDTSWLGVLAFSSEANAREFVAASKLEVSDVVAIAASDTESIAGLIAQVKKRLVRNLLLDLDYRERRMHHRRVRGRTSWSHAQLAVRAEAQKPMSVSLR